MVKTCAVVGFGAALPPQASLFSAPAAVAPPQEPRKSIFAMNISQLLTSINAQHATAFALASKLAGGNQDGAYVLAEADGRRAVLKQLFAPRALPIMRRLHAI